MLDRTYAEVESASYIDSMLSDEDIAAGVQSKLDLARGYAEMGEVQSARELLEEIIRQGDEDDIKEARRLTAYLKHRASV